MAEVVTIETSRFGRIEVEERDVITFSCLPGFPQARRFVVMEHPGGSLFAWLGSLDEPDVAFVIANPWHFFPGYDPPIGSRELQSLAIEEPSELEIAAIAHVEEGAVHLNLAAPLLINTRSQRGMQLISDDSRYGPRESLPERSASRPDETLDGADKSGRGKGRRPAASRGRGGERLSRGGAAR